MLPRVLGPRSLALALALLLSLATPPGTAHAATIAVNTAADELNNDGDCSLREAIHAANNNSVVDTCPAGSGGNDTITLLPETYTLTMGGAGENSNVTGDLDILGDLTINGAGSASTIIDGGGIDRVLHITGAFTVDITGVTIRNGSTTGSGGGIFTTGQTTLTNSVVSGNAAGVAGGGINSPIGTLTITASTVNDNRANETGGGIFNSALAEIDDSTISGNTVNHTGGIYNSASLTMANSTFRGNTALTAGGIFNSGMLTLNNSTVSNNTSTGDTINTGPGGGIMNIATTTLVNTTVSGNTAGPGHTGGGIFNCSASCGGPTPSLALTNSTLIGNSAASGGGIDNDTGGAVTIKNTIIAYSPSGGDCAGAGPFTSLGHNIDSDGTCGFGTTGDLSNTDPLLGPLQDNGGPTLTHALLLGSPAIDAGNPATPGSGGDACEATDQRLTPRPAGAACDIGAYEYGSVPVGVPSISQWALIGLAVLLGLLASARLVRRSLGEPA